MALTPSNPGQVSPPNDLTEQGTGSVAIPNDLTEQSAGSVAIPNNLTEQSAGSVAIPNNLTEQSAGSVAIPNNLTEQSAGSVAIPNNLTEQAVGTIPRTLDPILKLDFENEVYETTSNQGLDDIVTYTRNSSASFWNRRQDEQGRWETFLDTDYVGSVTNEFTQSENMTDSEWLVLNSTVESVPPENGYSTVFKLTENTSNSNHRIQNDITTVIGTYTASILAKANGRRYLEIEPSGTTAGNDNIVFDLETQKEFGEVGGQRNAAALGVSLVGAYDYSEEKYFAFKEKDLGSFLNLLKETRLLIGFNSKRFDALVLQPYFPDFEILQISDFSIPANSWK